jgi:hypothetical protein
MKTFLIGNYDDEQTLLHAIEVIRGRGIKIYNVYSPFPIHGLEHAMDYPESRLHTAGFIFGGIGTATAFTFMTWVNTVNWPNNFGGKPHFSFPAFIPIMFEFTVLCAAIGMTMTFLTRSKLYPGRNYDILEPRATDDYFTLAFEMTEGLDVESIKSTLSETHAKEIKTKEVNW